MESQLLVFGIAAISLFYFIDKTLTGGLDKKHIIEEFGKNMLRDISFLKEIETIIVNNDAWSLNAFPLGEITFEDYVDALKQKYAIEYSETELEKLRSAKLSKRQLQEYKDRILIQNETFAIYRADFEVQRISILHKSA